MPPYAQNRKTHADYMRPYIRYHFGSRPNHVTSCWIMFPLTWIMAKSFVLPVWFALFAATHAKDHQQVIISFASMTDQPISLFRDHDVHEQQLIKVLPAGDGKPHSELVTGAYMFLLQTADSQFRSRVGVDMNHGSSRAEHPFVIIFRNVMEGTGLKVVHEEGEIKGTEHLLEEGADLAQSTGPDYKFQIHNQHGQPILKVWLGEVRNEL